MSNERVHQVWKWLQWNCLQSTLRKKKINTLFAGLGRSVLGKTVPDVLSTYSRPRAQFFPIRTDLDRQITCLFFSSVEYFVSSFCVEFSLQPFSNLVYPCVWHLGNRKFNQHYTHFLGHYLHFTFFAVKKKIAGKDSKAGKLVAVRTRGPDGNIRTAGARAISQSDSRI